MPTITDILNKAKKVYLGSVQVDKIYLGTEKIWPSAYQASLSVYSWQYPAGASYTYATIPAKGGTAYVTWLLTVTQNGQTVYSNTVTPTSASLDSTSAGQGFTYTIANGKWEAPTRGTNNYNTSYVYPTQAQRYADERSSTVTVIFNGSVTINGESVPISTAATATMTQNRNYATYYSNQSYYGDFDVYLLPASTAQNPLGAGRVATTAYPSAVYYNYYKWDSDAVAYYKQDVTSGLTISCGQSWVEISGTTVTAKSRTDQVGDQRSATITASISGVGGSASTTLYQRENRVDTSVSYAAYNDISTFYLDSINSSASPLSRDGGSVNLTGTWNGYAYSAYTKYYSGTEVGTEGQKTWKTNQACVPAGYRIGDSGSWQNGNTITVGDNYHNLNQKTFTNIKGRIASGKNGNTLVESSNKQTLYQAADSVRSTVYTRDYTVDYIIVTNFQNDPISAGGGYASIEAKGYHTQYQIWDSDETEAAHTVATAYDAPSVSLTQRSSPDNNYNAFTLSNISQNASTGITTATLEHRHMHKITESGSNSGTDSVKVHATNGSATPIDSSAITATNIKSSTEQIGPKVNGTPYYGYRNYVLNISSSAYTTEGSAAPKANASAATITVNAKHEEALMTPWSKTHSMYYEWTSGDTQTDQLDPIIGTDAGNYTTVSDLGICTITAASFLTVGSLTPHSSIVGRATASVSIANNGGYKRYGNINVTRADSAGSEGDSKGVAIFQKAGNIAISVLPTTIDTTYDGGTYTIAVTAVSSGWNLTYSNDSYSYPVFSGNSNFSPRTADENILNEPLVTNVTVTVPQKTISQISNPVRYATITITAKEDSSITATVRVTMERPIIPD